MPSAEAPPLSSPTWLAPNAPSEALLARLLELTAGLDLGEGAAGGVRAGLRALLDVAGGSSVGLLVSADELAVLAPDAAGGASRVDLGDGVYAVTDGEAAEEIRDWEGASHPHVQSRAQHLVLPLPRGGLIVHDPWPGLVGDPSRETAMRIAAHVATQALDVAMRLREARDRRAALEETRRRLRSQNGLLRELAVIDELTGLHNRRYLDERLAHELERFERYRHPLAVALVDVDLFKRVNDTHGHAAGDDVLRQLARVAREQTRRVDLIGRYGGEELVVVMPDTSYEGAERAIERLRAAVAARPFPTAAGPLAITISAGVAALSGSWRGDAQSALRAADSGLYEAKEAGRDRVVMRRLADARPSSV